MRWAAPTCWKWRTWIARRADDGPGRDARLLQGGDRNTGEDPRPRRLWHRARMQGGFRLAASARSDRSDSAARTAARGHPARQADRANAGGDRKPRFSGPTGGRIVHEPVNTTI